MKFGRFHFKKQDKTLKESLVSELFVYEPVTLQGNTTVYDDLLLDTKLKGSITSSAHVTIGPNAVVHGTIKARSIHHQGSLEGNVSSSGRLVVQGGSKLTRSKIQCEVLEVQPGSQLKEVVITTA